MIYALSESIVFFRVNSTFRHFSISAERLGITKGAGVPSISRLQGLIEEAWAKGYDVQGCEQLGNKIVNTRKWIGATEIVAFLTSHNIKVRVISIIIYRMGLETGNAPHPT